MRYDHIQQLIDHAARTTQAADVLVGRWLDAPHDYAAGRAADQALGTAAGAARELRQAVQRAVAASVN